MTRFDARGTRDLGLPLLLARQRLALLRPRAPAVEVALHQVRLSGFLMTLRPFFFFGRAVAAPRARHAPGASPGGRHAWPGAGRRTALRRSILPSTFTPAHLLEAGRRRRSGRSAGRRRSASAGWRRSRAGGAGVVGAAPRATAPAGSRRRGRLRRSRSRSAAGAASAGRDARSAAPRRSSSIGWPAADVVGAAAGCRARNRATAGCPTRWAPASGTVGGSSSRFSTSRAVRRRMTFGRSRVSVVCSIAVTS